MIRELIRTWEHAEGFKLLLYDTFQTDSMGKCRLAYEFYDEEWSGLYAAIFEGSDFYASPLHAIDSDETIAALLGFLSLRPGDTDPDYFDEYSDWQFDWCQDRAELLSCCVLELEECH